MGILYSLCWEDPEILLEALDISDNDRVLSICSGGENIFSMLLKNPKRIIAIDLNEEQIYLTKLKVASIRNHSFEEFIEFLGFKKSKNRVELFNKVIKDLSKEELDYWDENLDVINKGIIHCGKLERYLGKFRRFILPLIITKSNITRFLQLESLSEQEKFFEKKWNNWRFKTLFKLFFSNKGMKQGRKKDYFRYSEEKDLASYYFKRTKHGLTKIPIKTNFFMQYILTGTILTPFDNHPYLDKENYNRLKELVKKIEFINSDLTKYIGRTKKSTFTKFNLSDIFELQTQSEYEQMLKELIRITNKEGVVCYWNNLVPRHEHQKIKGLKKDEVLSKKLSAKDKCHFYSRFIVEKIKTKQRYL